MRFRVLLAIQLFIALIGLGAFLFFAGQLIWHYAGPVLPDTVFFADVPVAMRTVLIGYGVALMLLAALTFFYLYIQIDRLIIRPVRAITAAMLAFTESRTFTPLSHVSVSTAEIRALIDVFAQFADNVEQVHKRDMEISLVKSDFISTAAHQLRTPLTGIRWALEALQKENLAAEQKALVDSAVAKSRDLVAIVGTLLDITSIESGKHKYTFKPTDIMQLVQDVISDFSIQAGERKVTLTLTQDSNPLPMVRADGDQVKWVLNNLVENGIRYTPEGGNVNVSFVNMADRVQVLVRDTGIGIGTKDRNNIFERFYRADNAVAKENKGNGLGLYIARQIATDHGGELSFAPNGGGTGTIFTLTLPTSS